jgi:hypothetical protein
MSSKDANTGMEATPVEDRRREFLKRLALLGATAAAPLLGTDSLSEKDFDLDLRSDVPVGGATTVADDPTSGCTTSCATCGCTTSCATCGCTTSCATCGCGTATGRCPQ